jgi:hypothetical protein
MAAAMALETAMFGTLARFMFGLVLCAPLVAAANLVVYDDQSENGFNDGCSFGIAAGQLDLANPAPVYSGADSIRFTPDNFNGLSWCTPATYSAATDYSGLDFWVNGGTTGGQNVDLLLGLVGSTVGSASLTSLNGGPIPANTWVHIQASFAGGLGYSGQFDQITFLDESGAGGPQADVYFDEVSLVPVSAQNYIFGDSLEPEYMFVPQFANNSIRVYQRTTNTTDFAFVNEASLGASVQPNAVAIAPDGEVWVLDTGATKRLLRYTVQALVSSASPAADVTVSGLGASAGDVFDVAFSGGYAYVSQSDFGATNRILKFALSDLNSGNNISTNLTNANLSVPVALAFDDQGRLWICNYGSPGTLVRMNDIATGAVDVVITGAYMDNAEGLSFDEYGTLWVGDNNEPTIYGYGSTQITASGNPVPIGTINMPTPGGHPGFTGYVGGIRFDRHGDVRANYEYDYSVRAFTATATPWGGPYTAYTSSELTPLAGATTDPGRGGIAIWPVPSTVHR